MSVVEQFQQLEAHVSRLIIGQSHLINRMLIALLCDGHLLVEGAPGLAKTPYVLHRHAAVLPSRSERQQPRHLPPAQARSAYPRRQGQWIPRHPWRRSLH